MSINPHETSAAAPQSRAIACDLGAIAADERDAHMARASALMNHAHQELREIPGGYAWRFAADQYDEVAAYVANERRCCPFFTFTLEVAPAGGPVWLRITGDDAAKDYLRSELMAHAPDGGGHKENR